MNKILDDFVQTCRPRWALVDGDYNVRGNIKTVVKAEYLKEGSQRPSSFLWSDKKSAAGEVTDGK